MKILVDGFEKLNILNSQPRQFEDVKIYGSDPWSTPAHATYRKFSFENQPDPDEEDDQSMKMAWFPLSNVTSSCQHIVPKEETGSSVDYQRWGPFDLTLQKGKELATIPVWGPSFRVTFDVFISSYEVDTWTNILHFTTGNNCCSVGDRIPMIKSHSSGNLVILNAVGDDGNHQTFVPLSINKWHTVEISQTNFADQVLNI